MWTCWRALAHWHDVHKRTLIDLKRKNLEFPGPSFWHFRKTRECYQRFAGEIVIKKPERLKIKKIAHDLDKASSQGLCDVFNEAKRVWCTQHTQERDVHKLKTIGCTQRSQSRVMSDIYGTQDAVLLQNGLADKDECDFDAKLESLKPVWEEIAPGFHHWFKSNKSKLFKIASFFLPEKISALKADFTRTASN